MPFTLSLRSAARAGAMASLVFAAACATLEPSAARHLAHHHHKPKLSPQDVKFAQFLVDFRVTALAAGIAPATYDRAMGGLKRDEKIEALTQSQPEFVKPVWSYLDSAVSPRRVADGQAAMAAQAAALTTIEAKYGVPREILVSIWGNETDFGGALGSFNIFDALATLAYDGPRTDFGRTQLIAALQMVQQDGFKPSQMVGSWAGAFGELQMLPTTFLKSAVDGDGDGVRDLWHSAPDALASAAAEVSSDGWQRGHSCGYEVRLPAGFAYEQADGDTQKSVADWTRLGVRAADGTALPANTDLGVIYVPAGLRGPAYLAFPNFKVILKYNNAVSYALAVCTLADQIAGRPGIVAAWPRDEQPLSRDERIAFQTALTKLGFNPGKIDGTIGHDGRVALRLYQKARGLPPDGFPTEAMLAAMLVEVKQKGL
ncbi:MAG TPA: lytic murein transglycosylase [Rhizomicrobium sp.]|jgi:membrane-bound lytic murein transglycosylase B|nr:lytic murein transglycosylase [Rhizomicrobium sp.]